MMYDSSGNGNDDTGPERAPAPPAAPTPVPMHLECPKCGTVHVDTWDDAGIDWSVRPHKTHLCLHCGELWKPAEFQTVGVPAAPEPGADLVTAMAPAELARRMLAAESENRDLRDQLEGLRHNQRRTESTCEAKLATKQRAIESAEAQLAAVTDERDRYRTLVRARLTNPCDPGVWRERALDLLNPLTPAPSPGTGEKT